MNTRIKIMMKGILAAVILLLAAGFVVAQTEPDPAIQEAKEETAVVYDLGRFFGYVHGMITEESAFALKADQKQEIIEVMEKIMATNRIEAKWAEETLEYLELEVLSAAQLMEVDRRAIEWQNNRETSGETEGGTGVPGSGAGAGTGTGPLSSYVAGGPFNPIVDDSKSIGQGFTALYEYLK